MSFYRWEHNSGTGHFRIDANYSAAWFDLSFLRLTGRDGIRHAHAIVNMVREVEDAAYRAGVRHAAQEVRQALSRLESDK